MIWKKTIVSHTTLICFTCQQTLFCNSIYSTPRFHSLYSPAVMATDNKSVNKSVARNWFFGWIVQIQTINNCVQKSYFHSLSRMNASAHTIRFLKVIFMLGKMQIWSSTIGRGAIDSSSINCYFFDAFWQFSTSYNNPSNHDLVWCNTQFAENISNKMGSLAEPLQFYALWY